jgi:hypothetical protein
MVSQLVNKGWGKERGEKRGPMGEEHRGEFYIGRLDQQSVLQSNCQIFSSSLIYLPPL